MRVVLEMFSFTKSSPTAGILDAQIWSIRVPVPYQAGDCPADLFLLHHLGSIDRIKQHGQQPRNIQS